MTPFFPRGNGPLISILLPSRGRVSELYFTIQSTRKAMEDKSLAEFVIKADDDDDATINIVKSWQTEWPVKLVVSPRGKGYDDLARFTNECCEVAAGDWLLLLNDDAWISTKGWDQVLMKTAYPNGWVGMTEICVLCFGEEGVGESYSFNAVRRGMHERLGRYSSEGPVDYNVMSLARCVDAYAHIDVSVCHKPPGVRKERLLTDEGYDPWHAARNCGALRDRLNDASFLLNELSKIRGRMEWTDRPGEGWHWWRRGEGLSEHAFFVMGERAVGPKSPGWSVELLEYNVAELDGEWTKLR